MYRIGKGEPKDATGKKGTLGGLGMEDLHEHYCVDGEAAEGSGTEQRTEVATFLQPRRQDHRENEERRHDR